MEREYSYDELHETPLFPSCGNCGETGFLVEIWTDDGRRLLLCDDCAAEERRVETLADQLAAMPSCETRRQLIEDANTTAGLVNALRAHDLSRCVYCYSDRKAVQRDREYVNPDAVCCEGEVA